MMYPDEYALWIPKVIRKAKELAQEEEFRAILASFPTAASVVAGAKASRATGLPYIVDYRDPWDYYGPANRAGPIRSRVERRIRASVISSASGAVAVSRRILDENLEGFPAGHLRKRILPQGWDPSEASRCRTIDQRSRNDGVLRIVHGGTLYPSDSDPEPLFEALSRLIEGGELDPRRLHLLFVGQVIMDVESLVRKWRLSEIVQLHGLVDREMALKLFAQADVLLLLRNVEDKSFISGKIWDYFTAGRPIFAVVDRESAAASLVTQGEAGWVAQAGSPAEIENHLRKIWAHFIRGDLPVPNLGTLVSTSISAIAGDLVDLIDEVSGGG